VSWRRFIPEAVKRPLRPWWRRWRGHLALPPPGDWFEADRIDEVRRIFFESSSGQGSDWAPFRDAHLVLPAWYRHGLDPWGAEYAAQQHRLWALVAGVERAYVPADDEKDTGWDETDPVRTPGFYARRDPMAIPSAADHLLASGMILKHCGLHAGDWALEYGAGFGQTALALARLGVNVDTVDISARFCGYVQRQAEHFQVPLQAFHGEFGLHPRPGQKYQLIWFYESFHHCVDFLQVVPRLAEHLADGGRVILGGEPIVEQENAAVPYPWGVRLHSEVIAVMRQTRWFELGFSEAFLLALFERAGFVGRRVDCEPSLFGRLHIFERTPGSASPG
jgi:SAM-dependent methyltransferase